MSPLFERILAVAHAALDRVVLFDGAPCTWRELLGIIPDMTPAAGGVAVVTANKNRVWLATLLACLRDGAVFCPLDPQMPPERLVTMMALIRPNAIVSDNGARIVGTERSDLSAAYLIFTSGSTGHPKGVLVSESGISNVIDAQIRLFEADEARFGMAPQPGF